MSAQVDKVTLKLFISMAEAGKVERALDLSRRLHLEQSFDIAMTVADQTNLRKLSDKIFTIKEERFNNELSDDEEEEVARDFDADYESDYEPSSQGQRKVTPDISKKAVDRRASNEDLDASSPSKMQKIMRRQNPFAKKRKESPTKTTPVVESSPSKKPMLSRMSTFSAQSRQQSKFSKQIM
jgi:chromosome transmission fidelity protein 4